LRGWRVVMAKLAIVATIDVEPGRRDELLSLLAAHGARCLRDEPGTLQFDILLPRGEEAQILSYEVYRDDAAFEAHRNGPSLARWREATTGMIARLSAARCTVLDQTTVRAG